MIRNNGSPRQTPLNSFSIENILDSENKSRSSTNQPHEKQLQSIKEHSHQSQDKQKEYPSSWANSNIESGPSGDTSTSFNASTYNSKQPWLNSFYLLPTNTNWPNELTPTVPVPPFGVTGSSPISSTPLCFDPWNAFYHPATFPLSFNDFYNRRNRNVQIRFSWQQTRNLETYFTRTQYLTPEQRQHLAEQLCLSDRQVKTWFQNRRAKWRRNQQLKCTLDQENTQKTQAQHPSNPQLSQHS